MQKLLDFHDVHFPISISFGTTGGPERRNEIVTLMSGYETRNARFSHSRRRYDAGTGVRSLDDLYEIIFFFEARRGSLHSFRFTDPFDMKSCGPNQEISCLDQNIGIGDGEKRNFPLVKIYGQGDQAYVRPISKPILETICVAVDGSMVEKNQFFFKEDTYEIVFQEKYIPSLSQVVTAGFAFDVPVRFDTESLSASITGFKAGQIPSIPLVEVRL